MDNGPEIKIRQIIKEMMYKNRLSLKVISTSTKIPYSTLFSWSEGRCPKDLVKAKRLANFFNISLDDLLFGKARLHHCKEDSETLFNSKIGKVEIIIKQEFEDGNES